MKTEIEKAMATLSSLYEAIEKGGGAPTVAVSRDRLSSTTALEFVEKLAANNITFIYNQEGATQ